MEVTGWRKSGIISLTLHVRVVVFFKLHFSHLWNDLLITLITFQLSVK